MSHAVDTVSALHLRLRFNKEVQIGEKAVNGKAQAPGIEAHSEAKRRSKPGATPSCQRSSSASTHTCKAFIAYGVVAQGLKAEE